jgi:hypothetical protein
MYVNVLLQIRTRIERLFANIAEVRFYSIVNTFVAKKVGNLIYHEIVLEKTCIDILGSYIHMVFLLCEFVRVFRIQT